MSDTKAQVPSPVNGRAGSRPVVAFDPNGRGCRAPFAPDPFSGRGFLHVIRHVRLLGL